jgi:hypothetical protein
MSIFAFSMKCFSLTLSGCLVVAFGVVISMVSTGCRKESFLTDASAQLEFSRDTVLFDTLFTTIGSTTQVFKVYNPHDESIKISRVTLEGGTSSQFRINVDGDSGTSFQDVEIRGGDSVFVFVEVTVDPGNASTPFIVEDRVVFETNGNEQDVHLAAWGQDAYFHGGLGGFFELGCGEVWNNDKPHVIYGVVVVNPDCALTINEGTQVFVHAKSGILVNEGNLFVQGSLNNEVVFQGDRLESDFANLPGQWGIQLDFQAQTNSGPEIVSVARGGIWIYTSPGSVIDYAIIKNGGMGIQVDSSGTTTGFALEITNTRIENMSGIGLWGRGGYIRGRNVLVGNCGEGCGIFEIGGKYQLDNCTFANYWSYGTRTAPAFALNNYYFVTQTQIETRPLLETEFRNCIMYGNNAFLNDFDEFIIDLVEDANPQYAFKYCLIDSELNVNDDGNHWESMINQQAPFLCNPSNLNFKISNGSSRMIGGPFGQFDITQNETGDWKGCYDFTGSCN